MKARWWPGFRNVLTSPANNLPRYLIRTPYNGVLASQTRHDYCPQSSMIRGVMSPGLVGRW
ncbi:hypothetical protein DQD43_07490 [Salmonella enterica subsp. enterica serovar Newport]|uniref:Uncharacterized protein n=1 Tax=Salmonella newport TaxID=108619 RepID=A0A5W8IXK4_SALNE|nr:hypothetical protein [Salmonella enterica subsp. enterica serovar Newport]EBQ9422312.1 hypothetical protein [Salmonella enterica subsp. enterica serovar Newport]EBS1164813.1 hypothetical protein [Salmonella enterica subsp. enterica serovar Newport]EBS6022260.1 hypothetical protein [Salmonella enterica subsp. enterica serovar Newport]EBU8125259.1 hypothetical protein [Salmonella enterica subsp. enterica serovar Newport]